MGAHFIRGGTLTVECGVWRGAHAMLMPQTAVLWPPFSFRVAAHFNKSLTSGVGTSETETETVAEAEAEAGARPELEHRARAQSTEHRAQS